MFELPPPELEFDRVLTSTLDRECPVFGGQDKKKVCPFSNMLVARGELMKKCPAFAPGEEKEITECPFKGCKSMAEVWTLLGDVPASHRVSSETREKTSSNVEDTAARQVFSFIMSEIHRISQQEREIHGECPKFSLSCPFKNLTPKEEKDVPLVDAHVYNSWPGLREPGSPKSANTAQKKRVRKSSSGSLPLNKLLKERTRQVHREAENVAFVRSFIKGKVGKKEYTELVVMLYHVYKELEEHVDRLCVGENAVPELVALWFPEELSRVKTLEADLEYYLGPEWRSHDTVVKMSPATKTYCERIKMLAAQNPVLLLSHAYTRYLGDLSGGQTLKRVAVKAMKLPACGDGTKFYTFDKIPSANKFKKEYRAKLEALDIDDDTAEQIAEEAIVAFRCNIGLFNEMDVLCGLEPLVPLKPEQESEAKSNKCPFATLAASVNRENGSEPTSLSTKIWNAAPYALLAAAAISQFVISQNQTS